MAVEAQDKQDLSTFVSLLKKNGATRRWRYSRLQLLAAYLPPKVKFKPAKYLKLFWLVDAFAMWLEPKWVYT